jgi:type I restriction enzyme S subunit
VIQDNIGEYPVYSSQTEDNGCLGKIKTFAFEGEYLTWTTDGANAGTLFYRTGRFNITNVCGLLKVKDNAIYIKYLYYSLGIEAPKYVNNGMGNAKLMSNVMSNIRIPVPPFPVQEEIVRILDKMVEQQQTIEKLIELRKKQYEYYREELLKPKEGWVTKTLGEIFELRNGYTPSKNNPEFWGNGDIPWYRMEDIRDRGRILSDSLQHITSKAIKGKGLFKENSFILATTATIGEHALLIADSLANQQFTNLSIRKSLETDIDVMFIYYYMFIVDEFCKEHTNVSGFESVDMNALKNMEISYPSVKEQEEIANALDKFESCISELTQTLEVCKKRYTHYRDELLRF